jgi:hypothetical protein
MWRSGFRPQLGRPWVALWPGIPVYVPPAFFWRWYAYDAYAPTSHRSAPQSHTKTILWRAPAFLVHNG